MMRWRGTCRIRLALLAALLATAPLAGGCGTVRLEAPPGYEDIRILEIDEPAEIRVERTVWYWMWGGNPISDNTTKQEIEKYHLKEIRMRTEQTLLDNLLIPFTALVTIVRRTMIVEGNTERALPRLREGLRQWKGQ